MFKQPLVVGVRQFETPRPGESVQAAIDGLGRNTGNMMFTQSLAQVLAGAKWGSFNFTPEDLQDRDAIVLASANWINGFEDFGWLADRLETTKLPVFLIGVGAQASLSMEIPEVGAGTRRLLDLVHDRSTSIAARGRFTCEVLERLGIKTAVETGCPSLLLAGADGPKITLAPIARETCAMHSTRHGFQGADPFQRWLYRQAYKHQYDLVLQSELSDSYFALESAEACQIPEKGFQSLRESYGTDDIDSVRVYLQNHGHVFMNYPAWIEYMKTRSLCFGTRVHGTVASLIAGIPATLICHDSRTLEMAKSMHIPMVVSTSLDSDKDLSIDKLFLPGETFDFLSGYKAYYSRFLEFFAANRLAVV